MRDMAFVCLQKVQDVCSCNTPGGKACKVPHTYMQSFSASHTVAWYHKGFVPAACE